MGGNLLERQDFYQFIESMGVNRFQRRDLGNGAGFVVEDHKEAVDTKISAYVLRTEEDARLLEAIMNGYELAFIRREMTEEILRAIEKHSFDFFTKYLTHPLALGALNIYSKASKARAG